MKYLQIIGTLLAVFVGIGRAYGGFLLIYSHIYSHAGITELGVGIGLLAVGILLMATGISFLINMSQKNPAPLVFKKILTAGMIAFWIDGIINGFLLFGAPQLSGQILNAALLAVVLLCLWLKPRHR